MTRSRVVVRATSLLALLGYSMLWLAWPAWVCFAVMGTGNHYWLDCVAGFLIALLVAVLLFRGRLRRVLTRAA